MATIPLPPDFSAFLKLLAAHDVRYLLVGGYAVGFHGYVRATADMDLWVPREHANAERLVAALRDFGFDLPTLVPDLFLEEDRIIRLGEPPVRIEIMTSVSGLDFAPCFKGRIDADWDDVAVAVLNLEDLKANKRASGRPKDLADLDYLD